MRKLDAGDLLLLASDEIAAPCRRSMSRWERDCAGFLGRWWHFFQKTGRRWMLLIIAVVFLLSWDAVFSQGCARDESCTRLFSNQVSKAFSKNRKDNGSFKYAHESYAQKERKEPFYRSNSRGQLGLGETMPASVVEAAVIFNESVLLVLNPPYVGLKNAMQRGGHQLRCVYARGVQSSTISVEDGFVQCEHPRGARRRKSSSGSFVTLDVGGIVLQAGALYGKVSWKKVVYGWVPLVREGHALLFVKGLAHGKRSLLPEGLECLYGDNIRTQVVAFCQENVRCKLPARHSQGELRGKRVTLILKDKIFPSVVRFPQGDAFDSTRSQSSVMPLLSPETHKPFFLCACTLVWNGAKFLKEWVMYHDHVGIERFFFYDNNSDDDIEFVLESLRFYNVSRHPWPWLKTQEASFSHCAITASSECAWVAFIDLDEFIFPKNFLPPQQEEPALHAMIKQYDAMAMGKLGQLKISNFNFGPSGLTALPKSGQMVNYICRMSLPRRVKSIVRVSAINPSYCSRVHHFELRAQFLSVQAVRKDAIIHHYKYQVWEDFKPKFVRRAATYVTDWSQNKDLDSFDRTPGLGTEAVEPSDWAHQFCEIEDTALREYIMNASQFHSAGKLVWE